LEAGATGLCVAMAHEGIELREHGISAPILVITEQSIASYPAMLQNQLIATLYGKDQIKAYATAATALPRLVAAKVHLRIDSGMRIVGAPVGVAVERARQIHDEPSLILDGVFSHLACADSIGDHPSQAHNLATLTLC